VQTASFIFYFEKSLLFLFNFLTHKTFTMGRILFLVAAVILLLFKVALAQVYCHTNGNVAIYSNYDGGYLNIDIDQNIPDLKIGITTYEKCEIHFSGPYVSNISQVIYAGYNGNNDHCTPSPPTTAIFDVPSSIASIQLFPPVTWSNTNGYYYIICNYSCDSATYQGGCNTPDQIVHYYLTQFGGTLYSHYTQYGCWQNTLHLSDGGNCCIGADIIDPQFSLNAAFSVPNDTLCAKDSVIFFNSSTNTFPGGTSYSWNFGDGTPADTNANPSHIYALGGSYTVTLTVTGNGGLTTDSAVFQLTILNCFTGIGAIVKAENVKVYPNPARENCCFNFPVDFNCNVTVRLYDVLGNMVYQESPSLQTSSFCLSGLKDHQLYGIYCAVISIGTEILPVSVVFE
jgi:hypothetical protein